MLTRKQIKNIVRKDAKYPEMAITYPVDSLDLNAEELAEIGDAKYVIFVDQSYITTPIAAHWEPVPHDLDGFVYDMLGA